MALRSPVGKEFLLPVLGAIWILGAGLPSAPGPASSGFAVRPALAQDDPPTLETREWERLSGPPPVRATGDDNGRLKQVDLGRAIRIVGDLGVFFAKLAETDPNPKARRIWRLAQRTYQAAESGLGDALHDGRLRIAFETVDSAAWSRADEILVAENLAGGWQAAAIAEARRGGDDWPAIAGLAGLLFREWTRADPEPSQAWFERHSTVAGFGDFESLGAERHADLVRYWFFKDLYLRASLLSAATQAPESGAPWPARAAQAETRTLAFLDGLSADAGPDWAARLRADWDAYRGDTARIAGQRTWLLLAARRPEPTAVPAAAGPAVAATPQPAGQTASPAAEPVAPGGGEAVQAEIEGLQQALAAAQAETRAVGSENAALSVELEAAREALESARAEAQSARQEVETAQRAFESAEAETASARTELQTAHGEAASLRQQLDQVRQALGLAQTQAARAREEAEGARAEAATARQRQASADAARDAARGRVAQLEDDLAAARTAMATAEREASAARDDTSASRAETAGLRAEIARMEAELSAARGEAEATAAVLASTQAEAAALARDLAAARQSLSAARADTAAARSRAAEAQSAGQRATEDVRRLRQALAASQEELSRLSRQAAEPSEPRGQITGPAEQSGALGELARHIDLVLLLTILLGLAVVLLAIWALRPRRPLRSQRPPATRTSPAPQTPSPAEPPHAPADVAAEADGPRAAQPVIEALRQGDRGQAERHLARLTGLEPTKLRQILNDPSGQDLALVCRAAGLDRLSFASIYLLARNGAHGKDMAADPNALAQAIRLFDGTDQNEAQGRLAARHINADGADTQA